MLQRVIKALGIWDHAEKSVFSSKKEHALSHFLEMTTWFCGSENTQIAGHTLLKVYKPGSNIQMLDQGILSNIQVFLVGEKIARIFNAFSSHPVCLCNTNLKA